MERIDKIIEQLELEYTEFTGFSLEERKALLPLTKPKQIKNLIWNLTHSKNIKISYKDYSEIMDVLLARL